MQQWSEADIRASLDGTFVKVKFDGTCVVQKVELDFAPCYRPAKAPFVPPDGRGKRRLWTREEDALLLSLLAQGVKRHDIARRLGRRMQSVCARTRKHREDAREVQ